MDADNLRTYFNSKFGATGIDHANDLMKAIEKIPVEHLSKPLAAIKSDLADIVMLGSEASWNSCGSPT